MRKILLTVLITILTISSYSQIPFEKGYYITNADQKIDAEIRILDAAVFEYRLAPNEDIQKATVKTVKEFGFYNSAKYIRRTVAIDRSSERISDMSTEIDPVFNTEELFLNVLVEGKSNLYEYADGFLTRYFYTKENAAIEQLIFKSYRTEDNKILKNNSFRQQLWDNLKCPGLELEDIKKISYRRQELVKFFVAFNNCHGGSVVLQQRKVKTDLLNLTLRPRINNTSLEITESPFNNFSTDFGKKTGFGFGLEAEFLIPIHKNNWGIVVEPSYQSFKASKTEDASNVNGGKLVSNVDYKSIELPISLRHYFLINEQSKIFINASHITHFNSKSAIQFSRADGSNITSTEINKRPTNNLGVGMGFNYKGRFVVEARYQTARDILGDIKNWDSEYKSVALIVGITLL